MKGSVLKRLLVFLCVIAIPIALFFNVWQSYRYSELQREVEQLETAQREAFERNKRLIAGIAVLRSPARVARIAEEHLGLSREFPDRFVNVEVVRGEAGDAR